MSTEHGMIEPFESGQVRNGAISYGCSSFGYDIRVADEYKVFTNVHGVVVDPKAFANSFALARTLEYFRIPSDTLVISNEGIAQLLFFEVDEVPSVTYAQRSAKGQKQEGVTLPRM
jgi:dCTP deaminase